MNKGFSNTYLKRKHLISLNRCINFRSSDARCVNEKETYLRHNNYCHANVIEMKN